MYAVEFDIKDMTESTASAFYRDLVLLIGRDGQFQTSIHDKRDDFNFHITNVLFLNSNTSIPVSSAYGVLISQLIRYARACSSYGCFILRWHDFQISFSSRDTWRNAWTVIEVVLWSIRDSCQIIWSSPFTNVKWQFVVWSYIKEQDKSSNIEQQPSFGDRKWSNTQHQNRGRGYKTNRNII